MILFRGEDYKMKTVLPVIECQSKDAKRLFLVIEAAKLARIDAHDIRRSDTQLPAYAAAVVFVVGELVRVYHAGEDVHARRLHAFRQQQMTIRFGHGKQRQRAFANGFLQHTLNDVPESGLAPCSRLDHILCMWLKRIDREGNTG